MQRLRKTFAQSADCAKIFLALSLLCVGLTACAIPTTHYPNPESTLKAAKSAIAGNAQLDFISTMSHETLAKHAQKIEFGWSEIRERFAFLESEVTILEEAPIVPVWEGEGAAEIDRNFVWPNQSNAQAVRRLRVAFEYQGERFEEDLLFVQEVDEADASSRDSPWIRVGEQWILRERHPNPQRYEALGRSLEERTNWRLVYPYYPFHEKSALARRVLESLKQRG